jgi:uncharacterized protein HemX
MDSIYTLLTLAVVILIGAGGIYFMRKYKIEEHEKEVIELTLQVIDLIVERLDDTFKYKEKLVYATNYAVKAYYLVEDLSDKSLNQQKALVKSYTIKLCRENDVQVDIELLEVIDQAVELILDIHETKQIS